MMDKLQSAFQAEDPLGTLFVYEPNANLTVNGENKSYNQIKDFYQNLYKETQQLRYTIIKESSNTVQFYILSKKILYSQSKSSIFQTLIPKQRPVLNVLPSQIRWYHSRYPPR